MEISCNNHLKPFSHIPGTYCLLPGSSLQFQIFPTLIRIQNLFEPEKIIVHELNIRGPVKDFTVMQDLEKPSICVWGNSIDGYFRYRIFPRKDAEWGIAIEKDLEKNLTFQPLVNKSSQSLTFKGENLFLGCYKKQDWEMINRRKDLKEIFPFWFRLGQLTPILAKADKDQSTSDLLKECLNAIENQPPEKKLNPFLDLFSAGFHGILSPRLNDEQFQGFHLPITNFKNPLVILTEGFKLIRNLFLHQTNNTCFILTDLPPQFPSGRLTHVACNGGNLDIEWTKKSIRRMIVYTDQKREWSFVFQKPLKRFRIRQSKKDTGTFVSTGSSLLLEANQEYFFDRFEK